MNQLSNLEISPERNLFRSREIARESGFDNAFSKLREYGLLVEQVERVKDIFGEDLKDAGSFVGDKEWEMLTVIELFHEETAEHCVQTYRIAKNKVERLLKGSNLTLENLFLSENVSLDVFYRSCLLHDVGKVDVPYEIISNTSTDEECAHQLCSHIHEGNIQKYLSRAGITLNTDGEADVIKEMNEKHLRPKDFTPARFLLSPDEAAKLEERGVDLDQTLAHLIIPHEMHSGRILSKIGLDVESELAKRHHNYNAVSKDDMPISIGALGVSVDLVEVLKLADVSQAVTGNRSYREPATNLETLTILIDHANHGYVSEAMTALWVRDEIERIYPDSQSVENIEKGSAEESQFKIVAGFLKEKEKVNFGDIHIDMYMPSFIALI